MPEHRGESLLVDVARRDCIHEWSTDGERAHPQLVPPRAAGGLIGRQKMEKKPGFRPVDDLGVCHLIGCVVRRCRRRSIEGRSGFEEAQRHILGCADTVGVESADDILLVFDEAQRSGVLDSFGDHDSLVFAGLVLVTIASVVWKKEHGGAGNLIAGRGVTHGPGWRHFGRSGDEPGLCSSEQPRRGR